MSVVAAKAMRVHTMSSTAPEKKEKPVMTAGEKVSMLTRQP